MNGRSFNEIKCKFEFTGKENVFFTLCNNCKVVIFFRVYY